MNYLALSEIKAYVCCSKPERFGEETVIKYLEKQYWNLPHGTEGKENHGRIEEIQIGFLLNTVNYASI
jgi:hypothetical protein